jgi:hypothetical protein
MILQSGRDKGRRTTRHSTNGPRRHDSVSKQAIIRAFLDAAGRNEGTVCGPQLCPKVRRVLVGMRHRMAFCASERPPAQNQPIIVND